MSDKTRYQKDAANKQMTVTLSFKSEADMKKIIEMGFLKKDSLPGMVIRMSC